MQLILYRQVLERMFLNKSGDAMSVGTVSATLQRILMGPVAWHQARKLFRKVDRTQAKNFAMT
jgi:hypothetical protein